MTNIENLLTAPVIRAVQELYGTTIQKEQINFQETRKEFEGELTLVVFPFTRYSKKSPAETGEEIGRFLSSEVGEIQVYNVVKGFLNISLKHDYWIGFFRNEVSRPDFGTFERKNERVMVEYSSPNTNKPLHLGHIRNNLLGYSVSEILSAYGYDVIKTNLVNDRGIHICKSMVAWQLFGNGETPESSGMKGDHLAGKYYVRFDQAYKREVSELQDRGQSEEEAKRNAPIMLKAQQMLQAWEAGDPEVRQLWEMMNSWVYAGFNVTYQRLGVDFDKFYYESDTYLLGKDLIEEGLQKGIFYTRSDGSVWIDLTADGLDEKLVLRADGTSVYMTQDIGTAQLKHDDYQMDKSIYVVGNEQDYHFKVLFKILSKLGRSWARGLYHLSYGMVDLPSGKMKSREGTVVDADDLMDEMYDTALQRTESLGKVDGFSGPEKQALYKMIGMGALKYFLLKVEPQKRLLFDPKESIDFQGHTGPFIQYTHARIQSVLNRAGNSAKTSLSAPERLSDSELQLIMMLSQYPEILESAAKAYSPALVANYAFDLAKQFNKFYHEESILNADNPGSRDFRLLLAASVARTLRKSMGLLGIQVPDRM